MGEFRQHRTARETGTRTVTKLFGENMNPSTRFSRLITGGEVRRPSRAALILAFSSATLALGAPLTAVADIVSYSFLNDVAATNGSTASYTIGDPSFLFSLKNTTSGEARLRLDAPCADVYGAAACNHLFPPELPMRNWANVDVSFSGTGIGITATPVYAGSLIGPSSSFLGNTIAGEPVYRTTSISLFNSTYSVRWQNTGGICHDPYGNAVFCQETVAKGNTTSGLAVSALAKNSSGGQLASSTPLYFGLQTTSSTPVYGWIKVSLSLYDMAGQPVGIDAAAPASGQYFSSVSLLGYGFDTSGAPIVAGLSAPPPTVPVPASAWLLGSALLGLVGLSRRRLAGAAMTG